MEIRKRDSKNKIRKMKKEIFLILIIISLLILMTMPFVYAQEAFVVLNEKASLQEAVKLIEDSGGKATHRFPPDIIIGEIPKNASENLMKTGLISSIDYDFTNKNKIKTRGKTANIMADIWNKKVDERGKPKEKAPYEGLSWGDQRFGREKIFDNPVKGKGKTKENENNFIPNQLNSIPNQLLSSQSPQSLSNQISPSLTEFASPSFGFYETSEYLIGKVAVGIIFLESNGNIDTNRETWTSAEETNVISKIQTGLNWLASQEPKASVTWTYDIHYKVPTSYEPITRPTSDESLWIKEAMSYLGYSSGTKFARVYSYLNDLKNSKNTNWAYAIFVVDDTNDADNTFSNRYFAYAYYQGPYIVMTYDNDGWGIENMDKVTAHETHHIFGADDEYCSPGYSCCSCNGVYGYLNATNDYCEAGCYGNNDCGPSYYNDGSCGCSGCFTSDCIMDSNAWCQTISTKYQIGWKNADNDAALTPIDCDDNNAAIYPGATEICNNLIDDNCNGLIDRADSDCSITVCKTGSCDYTSVQAAMNAVSGGTTIKITDGATYNERVEFKNQEITLDCNGATLSGVGVPLFLKTCLSFGTYSGVIVCDVIDITIKNCIIEGYSDGTNGGGIFMRFSNKATKNYIINNVIRNNNNYGIEIYCPSFTADIVPFQNYIENNEIYNHKIFGIYTDKCSDYISGNKIYLPSSGSVGIYDEHSWKDTINNNELYALGQGIEYGHIKPVDISSIDTKITNNVVHDNGIGIEVDFIDYADVYDNTIYFSTNHGLGLIDAENTIVSNNKFCPINGVDFYIYNSPGSSGDLNTCGAPNGWNDDGTTGCTYTCPITCYFDSECSPDECQLGTYRDYYCVNAGTYISYCDYSVSITDNDADNYDKECDNDCNDNNANVKPGATEICNGIDDNCDNITDPENANGCINYYKDNDGDGYGVAYQKCLCSILNPFRALQANDCNDNNIDVNPAAIEICNDNIDNNCDFNIDESGCSEKCNYIGAEFLVSGSLYYCDIDKILKPQKADGVSCYNNFECQNNFCSKNVCVNVAKTLNESKSLLQQIIAILQGGWTPIPWWNSSWIYRQDYTANDTASINHNINEPVRLNIDTASLISQGKLKNDCSDLRAIINGSEAKLNLDYGICNSADTEIWIQMPMAVNAGGSKTISIYYGNSAAPLFTSFAPNWTLVSSSSTDVIYRISTDACETVGAVTNLIDNNQETYWGCNDKEGQYWFTMEFANAQYKTLNNFTWQAALWDATPFIKDYAFQTSEDNITFTTFKTGQFEPKKLYQKESINFMPVKTKYFRLQGYSDHDPSGSTQAAEFELYESAELTTTKHGSEKNFS